MRVVSCLMTCENGRSQVGKVHTWAGGGGGGGNYGDGIDISRRST